jgi:hypothetical protein
VKSRRPIGGAHAQGVCPLRAGGRIDSFRGGLDELDDIVVPWNEGVLETEALEKCPGPR